MTALERFWSKVDKSGECWIWTGSKQRYGHIWWDGRLAQAHRVAFELANGDFDHSFDVLHTCDNPPCVRPDHLFLGDARTNAIDMVAKGRHARARILGERNGAARLTDQDVRQIRESRESLTDLAASFGVARNTIWMIRTGQRWKHVA